MTKNLPSLVPLPPHEHADIVGKRVRIIKGIDNWPDVYVPSGHEGVVDFIDVDGSIWVKLDDTFDGLKDWDNKVQIWDWNDEHHEPADRAINYITVIGGK
jgi:hypothetical protein